MIFDKQIIQGDNPENKQCIIYYSCDPNTGQSTDNIQQEAHYITMANKVIFMYT